MNVMCRGENLKKKSVLNVNAVLVSAEHNEVNLA